MWVAATNGVAWPVCVLVTTVSPARRRIPSNAVWGGGKLAWANVNYVLSSIGARIPRRD